MDQCTHCIVRGDTEKCNNTDCSTHESWYAQRLEAEFADLKDWKEQSLKVESTWDAQKVGELLEIKLGQDIRKNIQPKIEALQAELAECKASFDRTIDREDALRARCERLESALRNVLAIGTVLKDDTPEKPSVIFGHPDHKQWPAIFLAAKQALEVPK